MALKVIGKDPAASSITRSRRPVDVLRSSLIAAVKYASLTAVALVTAIPLLWMLSTSLKETGKEFLFPPQWIPIPAVWSNYTNVWSVIDNLALYTSNSFIVAGLATLGTVLSCSLVAFGFARMEFPGRGPLFIVLLASLMLPGIITLVPTYILFKNIGWIDTPLPLIVPYWFGGGAFGTAFYVFLIRQFMLQLPKELDEAAVVDGASYFRIYWMILMPLTRPALAASAIFSFIQHWNEFLHPLIFIDTERWRTLALALRFFLAEFTECCARSPTPWNMLMAGSVLMLTPVLIIFFAAQRYFIRGIALSGLGGR